MPRTAFDPHVHGFAFVNSWTFDDAERRHLPNHFLAYIRHTILRPVGALLVRIPALRKQLESHLSPVYGLCGGMCFAALDSYLSRPGLSVPRGQGANDQPAPGTRLHSYIWRRQLDSLVSDAVRFLTWLIFLNYVPSAWPFRGGTRWLLARSKKEWQKLKASVDRGEPASIGLMRDAKNVYDNHQVLVIGYDEVDETHDTLTLYDPNCPGQESTIRIEFGEQLLDGRESCGAEAPPPLRGFFCEAYKYCDPGEAVGL